MSKQLNPRVRNAVERSGFRKEVLQLAAFGSTPEEIADKLNEWTEDLRKEWDHENEFVFTQLHVTGFLNRVLQKGRSTAMQLQQGRDILDFSAMAKKQMGQFERELQAARRSNNWEAVKVAGQNLIQWFDRVGKIEGMMGPDNLVAVQINQGAPAVGAELEAKALARAVRETFKDNPEAWAEVERRARWYVDRGLDAPEPGDIEGERVEE